MLAVEVAGVRTRVVGTPPYPPPYCPGGCTIPNDACCEMEFESLSSDGAYLVVHALPEEFRQVNVEPQLYFLLASVVDKFVYLKLGLSLVLIFIGGKMLLEHFVHIPILGALGVVGAVLAASILASLRWPRPGH